MAIRPVPDRDSAGWWAHVARHEFVLQRCEACQTLRFPARAFCPACRTEAWCWEAVAPTGTVESWIVNRQPFTPGATEPYTVVMVRLSEAPGCLMYGGWRQEREPLPGETVTAAFAVVDEELSLIDWAPAVPEGL